jgi:hypothetical protein
MPVPYMVEEVKDLKQAIKEGKEKEQIQRIKHVF